MCPLTCLTVLAYRPRLCLVNRLGVALANNSLSRFFKASSRVSSVGFWTRCRCGVADIAYLLLKGIKPFYASKHKRATVRVGRPAQQVTGGLMAPRTTAQTKLNTVIHRIQKYHCHFNIQWRYPPVDFSGFQTRLQILLQREKRNLGSGDCQGVSSFSYSSLKI